MGRRPRGNSQRDAGAPGAIVAGMETAFDTLAYARRLREAGVSEVQAFTRLQELWRSNPKSRTRRSPETDEQRRYVANWREKPQTGGEDGR